MIAFLNGLSFTLLLGGISLILLLLGLLALWWDFRRVDARKK